MAAHELGERWIRTALEHKSARIEPKHRQYVRHVLKFWNDELRLCNLVCDVGKDERRRQCFVLKEPDTQKSWYKQNQRFSLKHIGKGMGCGLFAARKLSAQTDHHVKIHVSRRKSSHKVQCCKRLQWRTASTSSGEHVVIYGLVGFLNASCEKHRNVSFMQSTWGKVDVVEEFNKHGRLEFLKDIKKGAQLLAHYGSFKCPECADTCE